MSGNAKQRRVFRRKLEREGWTWLPSDDPLRLPPQGWLPDYVDTWDYSQPALASSFYVTHVLHTKRGRAYASKRVLVELPARSAAPFLILTREQIEACGGETMGFEIKENGS